MSLNQPKNVCYRQVPFIEQRNLPANVVDWIQTHKMRRGQYRFHWMAKEYVLIASGNRPNPGYQLEIKQIVDSNNDTVLYVEEKQPPLGVVYPQMVVYPYLLLEVYQEVTVEW